MAVAHAQAIGQVAHTGLVERAFGDLAKRAGDRCGGAIPGGSARGAFRPASQTRAESSRRRCGRRWIILNILFPRRPGGTDGPAKDPGRTDTDEETAVESGIPRDPGFTASFAI
jgi:hypothetical protein